MRGDSLRDLYAKALALLGLGLLGVAGALVDYWPVRGDLPTVASILDLPAPLTVPGPPEFAPAQPSASRVDAAVTRSAARRSDDHVLTDASFDTEVHADLADVLDAPAATVPSLAPPPAPPSLAVEPAQPDNIPSSTLSLNPPVIVAPEAFLAVPPVASPSSGDNMFEAAAKTAGRVGLKTGSAIASGFKAFGHVFRWPL